MKPAASSRDGLSEEDEMKAVLGAPLKHLERGGEGERERVECFLKRVLIFFFE